MPECESAAKTTVSQALAAHAAAQIDAAQRSDDAGRDPAPAKPASVGFAQSWPIIAKCIGSTPM